MTPPSVSEVRQSLRERLIESHQDAYDDAKETWKTLETKAQIVSTVSGVFLAAAFAFAREATLTTVEKWLLGSSVGLLAFAVVVALYALELATFPQPPYGEFSDRVVSDVLAKNDTDIAQYAERMDEYLATKWQASLKKLRELNADKAAAVRGAQTLVTIAVVVVAVMTIMRISQVAEPNAAKGGAHEVRRLR